jgi:hypothetical protein
MRLDTSNSAGGEQIPELEPDGSHDTERIAAAKVM